MDELDQRKSDFALKFGLTLNQYRKLSSSLTYDELLTCLELLKATKHLSPFRATATGNIKSWLDGKRIGTKPLTPAEFNRAAPKWPTHYSLPT